MKKNTRTYKLIKTLNSFLFNKEIFADRESEVMWNQNKQNVSYDLLIQLLPHLPGLQFAKQFLCNFTLWTPDWIS